MRPSSAALLPAVLFGLRTAASGMLALYVAFALQIDQPGWAATSAIIVAQPVLGASLRKGSFRLIGTLIGALFSVLLYAAFPQDRVGFLLGLALWGATCSFVSTYLRDFTSYAAMLAGYTAAIITMDAVSSPGEVLLLAVSRGSAIAIGVVCTGMVFSVTDLGRQRCELARRIDAIAAQALAGLRGVLAADPEPMDRQRDRRRALVVAVGALDPVVDAAIGENYDLRSRAGVLRSALGGLLTALSCWRAMEQHVRRLTPGEQQFRGALIGGLDRLLAGGWRAAGEALLAQAAATASQRLLVDRLGEGLIGLAVAQEGVLLLREPRRAAASRGERALFVSDWLTAVTNALRSLVVTGIAALVWVLTAWSSGPVFVTFALVVVTLYGLREESAFAGAAVMAASCALALLAAGAMKFALLPLLQGWGFDGYLTFAVVVGGVVALLGCVAALQRPGTTLGALSFATMANFMPLFSPTNNLTYDYAGFLNTAVAIVAGACLGAAGYRWLPPLSPRLRTRRALRATQRDLRRLLAGGLRVDERGWARTLYVRLVQLPAQSTLQQHAQVLAAMSVGTEWLRARALRRRAGASPADAMRLEAARRDIAEAVQSHPEFFAGLNLRES